MTASGVKFSERIKRFADRVSRRDRVVKRGDWRELLEILFSTLVVLGLWMLWNYGIWGWW